MVRGKIGFRGGKQPGIRVGKKTREKRSVLFGPLSDVTPKDVTSDYLLAQYVDALEVSVWAFAAIMRLSSALAQVGYKVKNRQTGEDAKGKKRDYIVELLDHCNPDETYFDFVEWAFVNLSVYGETFLEKERDPRKIVRALHHLPPANMIVHPGKKNLIDGYALRVGGGTSEIPREDIIFCRTPNPKQRYRGLSPICSIANTIGADSQAALYNLQLLLNGARPGGILTPTDGDLSDTEWERLREQFAKRGAKNAGSFLVLPAGFKYERDVNSLRDMDFAELRKFAREEVSAAFGVAPMMVQNFDSATYANSEQQLKAFWDYVGKPALKRFFAALNEYWVHPEVDSNLSVEPDLVGIDAMVDSEDSRVGNATRLLSAGMITLNEARKRVGEGPINGGDVLLVPLNLVPLAPENLEQEPDQGQSGGDEGTEGQEPDAPPAQEPPPEEPPARSARLSAVKARVQEIGRRLHNQDIRIAESALVGKLRGWISGIINRTAEQIRGKADIPEAQEVFDGDAEASHAFDLIAPAALEIIKAQGARVLRRLGYERTSEGWRGKQSCLKQELPTVEFSSVFSLENPRIDRIVREILFRQIKTATGSMLDQIKQLMAEGIEEGMGVADLAAKLESTFTDRSTYWATRIARTEAVGMSNLGTLEAFRAAGTPRRSWLSFQDGRVRDSHADIDGTTIPLDGFYELTDPKRNPSTARVDYPGDQACGHAWAVVGCRCGELPEQEEGFGLSLSYVVEGFKELEAPVGKD